jgi:uncharacterized membrane protein
VLSAISATGAVRVYVGVDEAGTPRRRAAIAVRRMQRRGAFDRSAVVLALPTGTGWVNPRAVRGFERTLGGDVATVAVQAGTAPSWLELPLNRPAHEASAQALLDAVSTRIDALPQHRRPGLHLYGESLGALVGQRVLTEQPAPRVCSVLWAGVPGGSTVGMPGERILHNADDPVVFWSPDTAVRRPEGWPRDRAWVPGLSYLTTSVDLLGSLGARAGHGHVYGAGQSWHLPRRCP